MKEVYKCISVCTYRYTLHSEHKFVQSVGTYLADRTGLDWLLIHLAELDWIRIIG